MPKMVGVRQVILVIPIVLLAGAVVAAARQEANRQGAGRPRRDARDDDRRAVLLQANAVIE